MDLFSILTLIGGLALFLYGMNAMGDGLAKVSGGKLEKILENLTSNPIKAVLLGAGVTAVIQSSSATTVMVVGFVNSGIMKLSQAVGVIMGANIGTTITSWILSLTGIQSDNFIIQMFKPTSFSPVLAIIGVIFILFINDSKKKDIGSIFIGFAILMYGMDMMSSAVKPLAEVPEFTNLLLKFSNPLLGVIAGALLTAVIQSSSASVGILQALCLTGAVPFSAAIPIIMGQNIGTCITAILSAIGAKKNAKRAAAVHLYFNLIGTVIFMTVFYLINAVVGFSFFHQAATPAGIAVIHSVFNVTATIILLPFAKGLEKLACLTIRDKKEDVVVSAEDREFMILEPRFLEKPAFAVEQSRNAARKMAEESHNALFTALSLVDKYSEEGVERVENMESKVDRYEDELGTYLVKLSHKDISEADSHSLSIMLHCIGDFERISDHAVNIMESAQELYEKGLKFSENAKKDLEVLGQAVEDIVNTAYEVFDKQDMKLAEKIEPLEEVIDELSKEGATPITYDGEAEEIKNADCIIVAADTKVPMDRFNGKKLIEVQVSDGISKADKLIEQAMSGNVPVYTASENAEVSEKKAGGSKGHQIYMQLMNGVSHMLPFVVGGGILIALAFLIDGLCVDMTSLTAEARQSFGSITPVAATLKSIGDLAFGFMLPVLAGFIAMSIADRPGLAVGFVGGAIAANGKSGFLGALVAGFLAGYLILLLKKLFEKLPEALEKIAPVLLYPVFGILIVGLVMTFVVEPPIGALNTALNTALTNMSGSSKVLLGIIVAGMMAVDMGGPFNKAAYVFGTASIAAGNYGIMAAVMIGGMVPPCAIALASLLFKDKFTKTERESAPTNFIMGLAFITEGAIPFAASDPLHVIPACVIGSGLAGALSMAFNCTLMAPHGGIFVFPVVGNPLMYLAALAVGTVVGALMLGVLKKKIAE